ncbi:MAG: hypothetical protein ACK40O_03530 [Allosphingosinicella sp.]
MPIMKYSWLVLTVCLMSCAGGERNAADEPAEPAPAAGEPEPAAQEPSAPAQSSETDERAEPARASAADSAAAAGEKRASAPATPAPKAAEPRQAGASSPYLAVNTIARPMLPQGFTAGRFEIADGCVVFRADAGTFTPVLPAGSRLEPSGADWRLRFAGRSAAIGERVNLEGGPITLGGDSARLAAPLPGRCPQRLFGVGG